VACLLACSKGLSKKLTLGLVRLLRLTRKPLKTNNSVTLAYPVLLGCPKLEVSDWLSLEEP
jgi:hypothetical protein